MGVSPRAGARWSLLAVTVMGTLSNNIINLPLAAVAADFDTSVQAAVLTVSAFIVMLAVAMPLSGWLGDRFGHRRVLGWALGLMVCGHVAAAMAPSLVYLVAARLIQGLACSAIPPLVMVLLVRLYPGARATVIGAWASANGAGQALGPPLGGLINDLLGWRAIFVLLAVGVGAILPVMLSQIPADAPDRPELDLLGTLLLVSGMTCVLTAITAVSQSTVPAGGIVAVAGLGLVLLIGYVVRARNNPRALIAPRLVIEPRFLRSAVAALVQMFILGSLLVAIPLLFTREVRMSTSVAGLFFFLLPLTMTLLAPLVGRWAERRSALQLMRVGLLVLLISQLVNAMMLLLPGGWLVPVIVANLVFSGAGMALVQTPAATGATRSEAGERGSALGVFNMSRFSGSALGAAWVAISYPLGSHAILFGVCAVAAVVALAVSYYGSPPRVRGTECC